LSIQAVARETGLERKRVLRSLLLVRQAMGREVPPVFRDTVEVDETYLGGTWRNKRYSQRRAGTKRGRGTLKTPVFGILCRGGQVWAQVVPNVEAQTLLPLIRKRVKRGSLVCSDTWRSYTGIATNGYVHRLVEHAQGEESDQCGSHINGLEGFWGYLKRRLAAKGGVRQERLPLYLAE
jgi:transposase